MINFKNTNQMLLQPIKEICNYFNFNILGDEYTINISKTQSGLIVEKKDTIIHIQYSETVTLFRALFILADNIYKDTFNIKQKNFFKDLAYHIDVSRNAVLNVDTIKDIVKHLAIMGYNELYLYTEDTLKIENEQYFGYMRGAYSGDEIKEIDNYCKQFGIELIPCIQTLAHLNQITRYAEYEKIIDNTNILLVKDERTYQLIDNIFSTLSKNFTSRKVNIGMDEAHMLGLGKYLDKYGYQKRFDIMIYHLERVSKICEKYGFKMQMWSDMFFRLVFNGDYYNQENDIPQELIDKIPKDIKLIYWDYYSLDYERYNGMLKKHLAISDNIGYGGGAWKWTGFTPHNKYSIEANEQAIKACMDNKVDYFMLTSWADNGAESSIYSVLPSIYHVAEKAYTNSINKEAFKTMTGIKWDDYLKIDSANELSNSKIQRNNANKIFLYNDLLIGTFDSLIQRDFNKKYSIHYRNLKAIASSSTRYSYIFETQTILCEVLSVKTELGIKIKKAYDAKELNILKTIANSDLVNLNIYLNNFYETFKTQWDKENKSFGFEVQCIRLGGLIKRIDYVQSKLNDYVNHKINKIDELEEKRLPFSYFENVNIDNINYNKWDIIVSPSLI